MTTNRQISAQEVTSLMFIYGMSGLIMAAFAATIIPKGLGLPGWAEEELQNINLKMTKAIRRKESLSASVKYLREQVSKEMIRNGLSVTPPIAELSSKYPILGRYKRFLEVNEKALNSQEIYLLSLNRRKKQILGKED